MSDKIETYEKFWLYYLGEHRKVSTRILHYVGTTISIVFLILLLTTFNWWYLLAGVIAGYFFAWIGHFFVEHNRPATFTYPFWSLYSDFRMYFHWVTGTLGKHLEAAGVK
ncbi:MAG: DUF962 domain-containing protein [Rhizobiaceae bacterium]